MLNVQLDDSILHVLARARETFVDVKHPVLEFDELWSFVLKEARKRWIWIALSSHSFSKNLKGYARAAGIEKIHIHQTRHTFARIISEETGSIVETQDALGHKNLATTRVYIGRIAVKRDKHSRQVTAKLNIHR